MAVGLGGRRRQVVVVGLVAAVLVVATVAVVVRRDEPTIVAAGSAAGAEVTSTTVELAPVTTGVPVPVPVPVPVTTSTSAAPPSTASTPTAPTPAPTTTPATTSAPTTTTARPAVFAVMPSRELPERAFVTLTGSGYAGPDRLVSWQCPAGVRLRTEIQSRCDNVWVNQIDLEVHVGDDGVLVGTRRPVRRVLVRGDGTDCAVAPGCELLLHDGRDTVLASVPLHFTGPSGPLLPMTVTATPTTDLAETAIVTVRAEHFHAGYGFTFSQCGRNGQEVNGTVCGPPVEAVADARGRLTASVPVRAVIRHEHLGELDCRAHPCFVSTGYGGVDEVPLAFR